jgi:ribosomal protein L7/L12
VHPSSHTVVLSALGRNKIAVIKVIRALTGLDLTQAKALVDRPGSVIARGIGLVEANRTVHVLVEAGATAEIADDLPPTPGTGGTYQLVLASAGGRRSDVLKVLRERLGLGLKDAHDAVERPPATILVGASREEAERRARELEDAGGVVELTTS